MDPTTTTMVENKLSEMRELAKEISAARSEMADICRTGLQLDDTKRLQHQKFLDLTYAALPGEIAPVLDSLQSAVQQLAQAKENATARSNTFRIEKEIAEETRSRYETELAKLALDQQQAQKRSMQEQNEADNRKDTLNGEQVELSKLKADHRVAEENLSAQRDALEVKKRDLEEKMDTERQALAKERKAFEEDVDKERKELDRQRAALERQKADQQAAKEELDAKSKASEEELVAKADNQARKDKEALSACYEAEKQQALLQVEKQALQTERQANGAEFDRLLQELRTQLKAASGAQTMAAIGKSTNQLRAAELDDQATSIKQQWAALREAQQALEQDKESLRDVDEERERLERVLRELNIRAAESADLRIEAQERQQRLESDTVRWQRIKADLQRRMEDFRDEQDMNRAALEQDRSQIDSLLEEVQKEGQELAAAMGGGTSALADTEDRVERARLRFMRERKAFEEERTALENEHGRSLSSLVASIEKLDSKLGDQGNMISEMQNSRWSPSFSEEWRESLLTAMRELKKEIGDGGAATTKAFETLEAMVQDVSSRLDSEKRRRPLEPKRPTWKLGKGVQGGNASAATKKRDRESPEDVMSRKRPSSDDLSSLALPERPSCTLNPIHVADTPLRGHGQDQDPSSGSRAALRPKDPSSAKTSEQKQA